MNPAMEMYTPQLDLQASNLNGIIFNIQFFIIEYQHSELDAYSTTKTYNECLFFL